MKRQQKMRAHLARAQELLSQDALAFGGMKSKWKTAHSFGGEETQPEPPKEPSRKPTTPPDWDAAFDENSGRWYFWNKQSRSVEWNRPDIFRIFTTGIVNWGTANGDETQDTLSIWHKDALNKILECIPKKYNVQIFHYDPVRYGADGKAIAMDKREMILEHAVNELRNDTKQERVMSSQFFAESFDAHILSSVLIEPYIVVDIAGLYLPDGVGKVKDSGHYGGSYIRTYDMPVIYSSLLRFIPSDCFSVIDHRHYAQVQTYSDVMFEGGYLGPVEEKRPHIQLLGIVGKITYMLADLMKKQSSSKMYQIIDLVDRYKVSQQMRIVDEILNAMRTKIPIEKIIENVASSHVRKALLHYLPQK